METSEMISMLNNMVEETDEDILSTYLELAEDVCLSHLYPFGDGTETVPDKHAVTQVRIAAYLLNKRGAEGETSHSENGVSVQYEDGDIPPSLLRKLVPMAVGIS